MTYTLPRLAAALSTAAALAACMPSPTPEQSATLQQSRDKVVSTEPGKRIMVGPEGFKAPADVVRVSPTRAVVIPVGAKLRYVDIEDAARQATGCEARATPEVYAAAGNDPKRLISMSKMRAFDYKAPVDLTC